MNIGKALSDFRLSVSQLIGTTWAPEYKGEEASWPIMVEGGGIGETLKVNVVHYKHALDWAFFKSNIEVPNAAAAFLNMQKRIKAPSLIMGGFEGGTLFKPSLIALVKGLSAIEVQNNELEVKYATNVGLGSSHVYLQVDHRTKLDDETENVERLVFIFVLKSQGI